ncbi:hypothetical protein [Actinacidiphila bryophytorum]|uniref:Uncharacterized protein n=1 Tax=Actinacidiphila bryophytorum TaxID=1436133 RepID=A0A9W4H2N9_9ACTN|nr:hypothetical protein [Actinacidiphila bryophytorum]MBM9436986.1 hypothetical protein [Actinacidiphila bryophytorum]MBN6542440.1 hypothetical protein [Actinacidiphila bryophytorum]CAG7646105.1 conserved hypothetical protein [Actinacidiphila bryophytorum]
MHHPVGHPPSDARPAPRAADDRSGDPATAARPVFVDPSGRRQRRVRRFGRLLVIPAAGYVALLLSAALGGPSVDSPYLPLPAGDADGAGSASPRATAPDTAGSTPSAAGKGGAHGPASPSAKATAGSAPTAAAASPHPSAPGRTTAPAAGSPATATPTVTHGRSTATHPVPTHTAHGRG